MDSRLLYKNEYIDEESSTDDEYDEFIKKDRIIEKNNILIINSKDRDWKGTSSNIGTTPETFNYLVKFAPSGNEDTFVGQSSLAHFLINFKDISSVEFTSILIPNFYLDLEEFHCLYDSHQNIINSSSNSSENSRNIRLRKLSDLPYICLIIDEIGNTVHGTNEIINKSTAILVVDDSSDLSDNSGEYTCSTNTEYEISNNGKNLIADTKNKMLKFKNITENKKIYYPNLKGKFNILNIKLTDPDGNNLKLLDDYLNIESVGMADIDTEGKIIDLINNSVTVSNAFDPSQSNVSVSLSNLSFANGTLPTVSISTSADGLTVTAKITGGSNFLENDYIIITDPGSTSNTATFFIKSVTGNVITLNTKSYFSSEEYKIGNKIVINNLVIENIDYYDNNYLEKGTLENFLNRQNGHYIIGLGESHKSNNSSRSKMFNQIQIPFEYILDKNLGNSIVKQKMGLSKDVLGLVNGNSNTNTFVKLSNTSLSTYNNTPINVNDYYNNKKIIFTNAQGNTEITTINNYIADTDLSVTVNALENVSIQNDKYRILMHNKVSSGRILNIDLQNIISFNVVTKKKDNSLF